MRATVKRSAWSIRRASPRRSGRGRGGSAARPRRPRSSPRAGGGSCAGSRSRRSPRASRRPAGGARRARRACRCPCRRAAHGGRCRPRSGRARDRVRALSLSSAYSKPDLRARRLARDDVERDPDRRALPEPEPKSAWRRSSTPIEAMTAAELPPPAACRRAGSRRSSSGRPCTSARPAPAGRRRTRPTGEGDHGDGEGGGSHASIIGARAATAGAQLRLVRALLGLVLLERLGASRRRRASGGQGRAPRRRGRRSASTAPRRAP